MAPVEDQIYRDIADAQKLVYNAFVDVEGIERDAPGWDDSGSAIESAANEAKSALNDLDDALNAVLEKNKL